MPVIRRPLSGQSRAPLAAGKSADKNGVTLHPVPLQETGKLCLNEHTCRTFHHRYIQPGSQAACPAGIQAICASNASAFRWTRRLTGIGRSETSKLEATAQASEQNWSCFRTH